MTCRSLMICGHARGTSASRHLANSRKRRARQAGAPLLPCDYRRIVMANWIPRDPASVARILRISSSYTPPPAAGFVSPVLWGSSASRSGSSAVRYRPDGTNLQRAYGLGRLRPS